MRRREVAPWIVAVLPLLRGAACAGVRGVVRDATGAALVNAEVEIRSSSGAVLRVLRTDEEGRFHWRGGRGGLYRIVVRAPHFAAGERVIFADSESPPCVVTLEPQPVYTGITVSATRGGAEEALASPHLASLVELAGAFKRPVATMGNALEGKPGILVQQSTYGQVSPFPRGLTGYHVLNLVDGVRFNNSTFRSGPNQYLALLEPAQAQRVEALLDPTGSQYGSDSLGGTQQDSGFQPYGVQTKLAVRWRPDQSLTLYGQRGVQDRVRGYKDLFGGLGRMQARTMNASAPRAAAATSLILSGARAWPPS
jgi:hypothetical protein